MHLAHEIRAAGAHLENFAQGGTCGYFVLSVVDHQTRMDLRGVLAKHFHSVSCKPRLCSPR